MGGNNGSTIKDVWYSSNDNASSWTQASTSGTMWSAGSGIESGVMGNRLYLIGSYVGNNTYKDDVLKHMGPRYRNVTIILYA